MAKNYKTTEVDEAVSKLVKGTVRKTYGPLGNRELNTEFSDLQEAASGFLINYPQSIFYLARLHKSRVLELVEAEAVLLDSVLEAITATGRYSPGLKSVTPLENAHVALQALETASSARDEAFKDITQVPAYKRYVENTDKFLQSAARAIKQNGNIVQPAQEGAAVLPDLMRELVVAHEELKLRAQYLAVTSTDFDELNLGALVAGGVIANARKVLGRRLEQLDTMKDDERNTVLREVTLDVLAARESVKSFSSVVTPSMFVPLEGAGSVYADTDHPIVPAVLPSEYSGPYTVVPGESDLNFRVEGTSNLTIPIQASYLAALDGNLDEPFTIYGPSNPPPVGLVRNDRVVIEVPGYPLYDHRIGQGNIRAIQGIIEELNAGVTTQPIEFEPHHRPERYSGNAALVATGATYIGGLNFVFSLPGQSWLALGVKISDTVWINDESSPNNKGLYTVGAVTATVMSCQHTLGPPATNESSAFIEVGPPWRHVRVKINDADARAAIDAQQSFKLVDSTDSAFTTLGFPVGVETRCRKTPAQAVADSVNKSQGASVANVARMRADVDFVVQEELLGHSDVGNPLLLSLYRWRGSIPHTAGTSVVFTVTETLEGNAALLQVGGKVVLRTAPAAANVGAVGTITARTSTTFTASFSASVPAGTSLVELAPASVIIRSDTLVISEGQVDAGDYVAQTIGTFPGDVTLDRPLPLFQALGGQPYYFSVSLGGFRVRFASLSTALNSRLEITGGSALLSFFDAPTSIRGQAPFMRVPSSAAGISLDDVLEFYDSSFNVPSATHTVVGLEPSQALVQLEPPVDGGRTNVNFSTSSQPPFARIRRSQTNNYQQFRAALLQWLELPQNQPSFLRELDRLINPLVVNANPTASAIGAAKAQVQSLLSILTKVGAEAVDAAPESSFEAILLAYQATIVPKVDTLLDSFRQKGADRAVDLLIEGRFQVFFGLSQDGVSYLGDVLERLREVQREDLPVRKSGRKELAQGAVMLASYEEPDADFDLSDAQEVAEVDIPGNYTEARPGSVY